MRVIIHGGFLAEVSGFSEMVKFFFIYLWESKDHIEFPIARAEAELYSWTEKELGLKFVWSDIIDYDEPMQSKELPNRISEARLREIRKNVGIFDEMNANKKKFIKKFFKEA